MRNYALKDLGERDRPCGKCGEDDEKYTRCKWCGIVRADKPDAVLSNSTDLLNAKSRAKLFIDANFWDADHRADCVEDQARFTRDELEELIDEMLEHLVI